MATASQIENRFSVKRVIGKTGNLLAVIGRIEDLCYTESWNYASMPAGTLQVGGVKAQDGRQFTPHIHKARERQSPAKTEEWFFVFKGLVEGHFYDDDKTLVESVMLPQGTYALLISGGHSFDTLQRSQLVEVKTGPFITADADKERF